MTTTNSQTGNVSGVCYSTRTSITPPSYKGKKSADVHLQTQRPGPGISVNTAKYLGVDLSNNLSWNSHKDRTANKANSMLGFLCRNLRINNSDTKAAVYMTLVRFRISIEPILPQAKENRNGAETGSKVCYKQPAQRK